jgi:hypothetical protein
VAFVYFDCGTNILTGGTNILTGGTNILTDGTNCLTGGTNILTGGTNISDEQNRFQPQGTKQHGALTKKSTTPCVQ